MQHLQPNTTFIDINLEISKNTYNDLKENKQENFLTPKVVAEKK